MHPFWELLDILGNPDSIALFDLETDKEEKKVKYEIFKTIVKWFISKDKEPVEMVPCLYCGQDFEVTRGLNVHLNKCDQK